jgi:hypothetical protein
MKRYLILLVLPLFILFSCDKVDDPFPPTKNVVDTGIVWDDSVFSIETNNRRFVLMEEFTGHTCTNCPAGATEVERLAAKYAGELVPISIHASSFAKPKPGYCQNASFPDCFSSDYRTTAGEEYLAPLGIDGLPGGLVSRTEGAVSGQTGKLTINTWAGVADNIIGTTPVANLSLVNYYDDSTKTFQVKVNIEWLSAHTGDFNLQVQLLEDSIVDWQQDARLDPNPYVQFYTHRHMFRDDLNGIWGEPLETASANDAVEIVYTRAFDPDAIGYKIEHMSIVAFIYKRGGPIYEVMQVNQAHLTNH